jgi:hypothetical protein
MKHSKLKEYIKKALFEAGLFTLKNPTDANKGLSQTIDPDDNTEKSPEFLRKYKKVTESVKDAVAVETTKTISELQKRINYIENKYKTGDLNRKEYISNKKDLQEKLNRLNKLLIDYAEK